MKRIEPSARLINRFTNVVSWVLSFKFFFIFKRIMPLSIRHSTRVKPNINQIFDAPHLAFALSTYGRCKSSSVKSLPAFSDNSLTEPTHSRCLHSSHSQIGKGVPQYRSRLNDQSILFSSQFPKRPFLIWSGVQ